MADATYTPKVYMKQGGAEQVIASSGTQTIESGGTQTFESGGYQTFEDGSYSALPVVTETTSAALSNFGISYCASTGTKELYSIDAPAAGLTKYIVFAVPQSTGWVNVKSTGAAFVHPAGTGNKTHLKVVGNGAALLAARNASNWYVVSHTTTVSVTSSAT